jgi:STE24 endopeptidase
MFRAFALILILARWATQFVLERLNARHASRHADRIPESFRDSIDQATYRKSIDYTLAKGKLAQVEATWDTVILLVVLFTGFLPWALTHWHRLAGDGIWAAAGFLFMIGVLLSLSGLPLEWYHQFRLEDAFGFNTTTRKLWWTDRIKGLLLSAVLGYPLLVLLLKLVDWTGSLWWLWGWATLILFQFIVALLAPVLILPLFNTFAPLPEGSLKERLLALAARTRFHARSIQLMDGSKRSRHSNAFFIGFSKFRKIVLFDTLVSQLAEPELEAVLAHEIGHCKKRHVPKRLFFSAITSLGALYLVSLLSQQPWFYRAFGFEPGNVAVALLLFGLLSGAVGFWFGPFSHWWSRKHEYEADRFAAQTMREPASLIGALRKLHEKNLSNLLPHPAYSRFYYSHPTLTEREAALKTQNL